MIALFDGKLLTDVDVLDRLLPSVYAGTHLLKQLAARPATRIEVARHQGWGFGAAQEFLDEYTIAGLLDYDEATKRYSLNISTVIDLLDLAWLKHPHEIKVTDDWDCAGTIICDGIDHITLAQRGPDADNGNALFEQRSI